MNKEEKLIPDFRFPEFKSNGAWKASKIGSFSKVSAGGTPSSNEPKYWGGEIPWMNSGELNLKRVYDVENRITELGLKESSTKKIPPLCVLIGLAGQGKTRGTAAINYIELCTNQSIAAIHPNQSKFDSEFLFQKVDSLYQKLRRLSTGQGGRGGLNLSIIREIQIPLPSLDEQQKIASCLSSLDELIAAHNDKLNALKDHKKGLLQNLFPQEGETVPKIRFPEFEDDGDWVERTLESLTDKVGDGIHTTPKYDQSGKYHFINGNNLIEGRIYLDEKTKRVTSAEYKKHKKDLTEKTIFLSINGTIGNVAFYNNEKVVLGKSACYITPSQELNNTFLYYSLQSPKISGYFFSELTGSTIKNLSLRTIRETDFNLPSEKEQQKIASCLSAVDKLITAQSSRIEQLQLHKKGLMQGMFPTIK